MWLKAFWVAVIFLTRLPAPTLAELRPEDEGRALLCFPLVGFLIGALLCGVAWLSLLVFNPFVSAGLVLAFWAAVTGGIHLDGLADSADGWLGAYGDKARTLEIMQDSRCGSGALVAVCCALILKFCALAFILEHAVWPALFVAPAIGRCAGPLLFIPGTFFYAPYVQPSGLAEHFIAHCPRYAPVMACIVVVLSAFLVTLPTPSFLLIITCALSLFFMRRLMMQRLGGATGDTAGASTEVLEIVVLLSCGAAVA